MNTRKRIYCRTPVVPERKFRLGFPAGPARAIQVLRTKWVPGTVLPYCFLEEPSALAGNDEVKLIARKGFDAWTNVGIGIAFEEVSDPADAKIRIGFKGDDGYWSWVGRDILNTHYLCLNPDCPSYDPFESDANTPVCPICASKEIEVDPRTMNLDRDWLPLEPRPHDVSTHEIGHSLGLPHEHQSPFSGIEWNTEAVYNTFMGPPNNWTKEVIDSNILDKLNEGEVEGSAWDPDSIMEYEFEEGLILRPEQYQAGLVPAGGISARDKEWIQHWYPPSIVTEAISLNTPVVLNLQPGKVREYSFSPLETRPHDIQTFGEADTVMVLFEEINGRRHQLAADDDSGENRNAHLLHTLNAGARYILSIRMYWNWMTPSDAMVKVW
jgi:hypothetical protein